MEYLKTYLELFQNRIPDLMIRKEPQSLYEPSNYIIGLGGKRIRPALALMAAEAFGADIETAIPAAQCVEMFHNFSLVHDDIMDEAPLRRGMATVHERFGVNTAILTGDVMLIKAYEFLANYPDDIAIHLIRVFNKMAVEVCEGQQWDMDFEKQEEVAISSYIKMIEFKTAVLLGASLQMGAIVAGANEKNQHHINGFGVNIGIAFQIQDDILDTYGTADQIGKTPCGDIIQNKKTYLFLKALELGTDTQVQKLRALYATDTVDKSQKVEEVKAIFDSVVVQEYANQVKNAYLDLAVSHIHQLEISDLHKAQFLNFASFLVERSH